MLINDEVDFSEIKSLQLLELLTKKSHQIFDQYKISEKSFVFFDSFSFFIAVYFLERGEVEEEEVKNYVYFMIDFYFVPRLNIDYQYEDLILKFIDFVLQSPAVMDDFIKHEKLNEIFQKLKENISDSTRKTNKSL